MMIDRLEQRLQYANLAGYVYNDADQSKTFDANEKPMTDTTVFLDANANGKLDGGETTTTPDSKGYYQFTGLAKGDYVVGTTTSTTDFTSTTATPTGTRKGRFDIVINGLENTTPAVRAAFEAAKTRWEAVITGDMPDVKTPAGKYIDDLEIDASIGAIDGVGGSFDTLGYTQVTGVRDASEGTIPYSALMRFDSANLAQLQATNELGNVILHEMGHALGFGSIWSAQGLITGRNSSNPRYVGTNAVREYNDLFKRTNLSVPIENTGGSGSRNYHWRDSSLNEELMTSYANSGASIVDSNGNTPLTPLSKITVGQFDDEGYQVNYDAADVWNPLTHDVTLAVGTDYGAVANERRITLAKKDNVTDLDMGYTTVTAPVIRSFSINPSPVAQGENIVLSATSITDDDGDKLGAVTFYRESNGVAGLQKGSDTYISSKTVARNKAYTATTGTGGLTGDQVYYALATDSSGRTGRRVGVVNVSSVQTLTDPPTNLAVNVTNANTVSLSFTGDDAASGYRIQLSTSRNFNSQSLIREFNVSGTTADIDNLQEGVTYYVRVRGYNLAGASPYSSYLSFETA